MGFLIKKNTPFLFLRIPDYKKYNAIDEHIKKIDECGFVWLIKLGRCPNYKFIKQFIEQGGNLILKSSPKNGDKFYLFKVETVDPKGKIIIPDYYNELFDKEFYDLDLLMKTALCLKLVSYKELSNEQLKNMVTISKQTSFVEAVIKSRCPHVYVENQVDFKI